jgi:DNA-binding MarR family transcriptional regulator
MKKSEIRQFRRTLRQFERITNSQLKGCCIEVTLAQCLVLMEVDDAGRLTVGELASRLRLDDSTLSRTIDGLVRRGLLDRSRDEQDRRVVRIRLTPQGDSICAAIHEQNDAMYRIVFDRIPVAKRGTVLRSFSRLVQAFLDSEEEVAATCAASEAKSKSS